MQWSIFKIFKGDRLVNLSKMLKHLSLVKEESHLFERELSPFTPGNLPLFAFLQRGDQQTNKLRPHYVKIFSGLNNSLLYIEQ
jgi:hypothetical protein